MTESSFKKALREMIEDMSTDIVEERAINYVIREVHQGRSLAAVLQDPYIKNRLDEEKLKHILENEEVIKAVEEEITQAFKDRDFKFTE